MAFHHIKLPSETITADYSILLSPIYRVPVLYIYLYGVPAGGPQGIDVAYQYLVPESSQQELSTIGVVGGISMTVRPCFQPTSKLLLQTNRNQNHPVTDIPCYFIHPCKTAEAMEELIDLREISRVDYLRLWIGLMGRCVGLYLPKELAVG